MRIFNMDYVHTVSSVFEMPEPAAPIDDKLPNRSSLVSRYHPPCVALAGIKCGDSAHTVRAHYVERAVMCLGEIHLSPS